MKDIWNTHDVAINQYLDGADARDWCMIAVSQCDIPFQSEPMGSCVTCGREVAGGCVSGLSPFPGRGCRLRANHQYLDGADARDWCMIAISQCDISFRSEPTGGLCYMWEGGGRWMCEQFIPISWKRV